MASVRERQIRLRAADLLRNMTLLSVFRTFIYVCLFHAVGVNSLHLKGSWSTSEFFKFLSKFGFQQTNLHDQINTQGYIYGNITSPSFSNLTTNLTFVVVDSEYFLQYYSNRTVMPRTKACPAMFAKIDKIAWDNPCHTEGEGLEDFLRKIPCPEGEYCFDEDMPDRVVDGYQFTYAVRDTAQPRFWYTSMVSCYHNTTNSQKCWWNHNDLQDVILDYDVWLVNGNPFTKHVNPFEHQFSFEMHDVFEIYLAFFVAYTFLVPLQLYALSKQKHQLPLILTTCMSMEYVGIVFNFIHIFKFAFDGEGVDLLHVVGNFIDQISQCLFMLLLLLVVKGWTITRNDLTVRSKSVLFTIWGSYTVANLALFIWNQMAVDFISGVDEWQTWPGYLILTFRIAIMVWFLLELRETFLLERSKEKMRFYLHFGAGFLVWFVYLPILAIIGTQVSALWRFKTILSVTLAADFLSYVVMTHLLWPSRSYLYFNLKMESRLSLEELEFTGRLGLTDDFDSMSEDSFDQAETYMLLRQQDSPQRQQSRQQTADWLAKTETEADLDSGANQNKGNKTTNGEHCDSGVESLANGDNVIQDLNIRPHFPSEHYSPQIHIEENVEESE